MSQCILSFACLCLGDVFGSIRDRSATGAGPTAAAEVLANAMIASSMARRLRRRNRTTYCKNRAMGKVVRNKPQPPYVGGPSWNSKYATFVQHKM
eukprot:5481111-Heterocapsa_arctica.AAC.1